MRETGSGLHQEAVIHLAPRSEGDDLKALAQEMAEGGGEHDEGIAQPGGPRVLEYSQADAELVNSSQEVSAVRHGKQDGETGAHMSAVMRVAKAIATVLQYNELDADKGFQAFDEDEDGQLSLQDLVNSAATLQVPSERVLTATEPINLRPRLQPPLPSAGAAPARFPTTRGGGAPVSPPPRKCPHNT